MAAVIVSSWELQTHVRQQSVHILTDGCFEVHFILINLFSWSRVNVGAWAGGSVSWFSSRAAWTSHSSSYSVPWADFPTTAKPAQSSHPASNHRHPAQRDPGEQTCGLVRVLCSHHALHYMLTLVMINLTKCPYCLYALDPKHFHSKVPFVDSVTAPPQTPHLSKQDCLELCLRGMILILNAIFTNTMLFDFGIRFSKIIYIYVYIAMFTQPS